MTARIVSAEEARGLLSPRTYQPGMDAEIDPFRATSAWIESAPTGAPDSGGDVVALVYRWDDGRGRLAATAPDLAHTVTALEGERDAALARAARLERVLAVEAGDESQALEGWRTKSDRVVTLWHRGPWSVYRHRSGVWRAYRAGSSAWIGEYPSALEAMEAADAAGEVKP